MLKQCLAREYCPAVRHWKVRVVTPLVIWTTGTPGQENVPVYVALRDVFVTVAEPEVVELQAP
jgi:hypothetical protein